MPITITRALAALMPLCLAAGCASVPSSPVPGSADAAQRTAPDASATGRADELTFVDLPSFDQRLAGQLSQDVAAVSITFYDQMTISRLPERLQNWLTAVENEGGKVQVQSAPVTQAGGITAKSPLLVVSAIATLWSARKTLADMMYRADLKKTKAYDATLVLKVDPNGSQVLDRIVLNRRSAD